MSFKEEAALCTDLESVEGAVKIVGQRINDRGKSCAKGFVQGVADWSGSVRGLQRLRLSGFAERAGVHESRDMT